MLLTAALALEPGEIAVAFLVAAPLLYLLLLAFAQLLRRGTGVRFGFIFHLFALSVSFYVPLRILQINVRPGPFDLQREIGAFIVVLSACLVIPVIRRFVWELYFQKRRQVVVPNFLQDVVALVIVGAAVVLVLGIGYGQTVPGLLTGSGILALVLGLAMQDLLGNVIAGMSLQVSKPFKQGDWLIVDGKYAEIIEINWRSTRLRTNDHITLDIPNSKIAQDSITNLNYPWPLYSMRIRVGVDYDTPPQRVKEVLREAALASLALKDPPPKVFLVDFGDHAVVYEVKYWMKDHSLYNDTLDSVQTNIWYALKRAGITIPYPIRTLHHERPRPASTQLPERVRRKLLAIDFFSTLGEDLATELLSDSRHLHYGRGETIVRQGEKGDSMFAIVHGTAKVQHDRAGKLHEVGTLKYGDCFGEMSLLTGDPRSASIIAESDCELIEIAKEKLAPVLEDQPALLNQLSNLLAERRLQLENTSQVAPTENVNEARRQYAASFLSKLKSFFEL